MKAERRGEDRRTRPAEVELGEREIQILESHHASGFEMQVARWPFHKVCWVAVGRGRLEGEWGAWDIERDSFLLLPAGWAHRFVDDPAEPLTLVIVCLSLALFEGQGPASWAELWERALERHPPGSVLRPRTGFHRSGLVDALRLALHEQGQRNLGWRCALQSAAGDLLVRLARGHCEVRSGGIRRSEASVAGAIEYIDQHPYEPLRIDEMATRCQLSPRRFTELFRKLAGETFSQRLARRRIEHARDRLRETGHILYACYESGFNDPAYFYRVFKRQTGMTPGEFLKGCGMGGGGGG